MKFVLLVSYLIAALLFIGHETEALPTPSKVGNFFSKVGNGIKDGATAVYNGIAEFKQGYDHGIGGPLTM